MNNKNLDELLLKWDELLKEEERLDTEKEELKTQIMASMEDIGVKKYENNNSTVSVTTSVNISYKDELAIINYLNNHGYKGLVKNKLDTPAINKELKKTGSVLSEALRDYYSVYNTDKLTIKRKGNENVNG